MITPEQIAQKANREFRAFLIASLTEQPFFPRVYPVGRIARDDWERYRSGVQALKQGDGKYYRIEWVTRRTRAFGDQTLPERVVIDRLEDYLALTRRTRSFAQFIRNVTAARTALPALESWMMTYPLALIRFADVWLDLLQVCQYFVAHPRPDLYIRELPIRVHTKFIETHTKILRSMLDAVLHVDDFDPKETHFARRYGLRYDMPLIRARLLAAPAASSPFTDFSLPIPHMAAWTGAPARCLIVENRMTFLTVPPLSGALALWGGGYRAQLLGQLGWLKSKLVYYWGDIDAHGFHILSMLRHALPDVESIMMDAETFDTHSAYVVPDTPTARIEFPRLTSNELALYTRVQREGLRLEQEHIPQAYIVEWLNRVLH